MGIGTTGASNVAVLNCGQEQWKEEADTSHEGRRGMPSGYYHREPKCGFCMVGPGCCTGCREGERAGASAQLWTAWGMLSDIGSGYSEIGLDQRTRTSFKRGHSGGKQLIGA